MECQLFLRSKDVIFFFTLDTGPRRSLSRSCVIKESMSLKCEPASKPLDGIVMLTGARRCLGNDSRCDLVGASFLSLASSRALAPSLSISPFHPFSPSLSLTHTLSLSSRGGPIYSGTGRKGHNKQRPPRTPQWNHAYCLTGP